MKKIYILSGLMCLLPGLSFGENPRIAELTRSKQEKMERLQKCEGTTKALKIAGLSTIGLTAVGVVGNVVESQKIKEYQGQSNALDTQIAQTKKEIEDKKAEIEKNKAAAAAEPGPSATPPAATPTTSTTTTTTRLADVDKDKDGSSLKAYSFKDGTCDIYANDKWEYDVKNPAQTCSELEKGQWKVEFEYGTVRGEASCNTTGATKPWRDENGNVNNIYTLQNDGKKPADAMNSTSNGQYCWCRATKFEQQDYASSSWVFMHDDKEIDRCERYCAEYCAYRVQSHSDFRAAVFAGAGN